MSKVVTVMNMKGGVGKTTVSMHIASCAAAVAYEISNSRRVLLIDYDPQFNLSQALLPAKIYYGLEAKKATIMSVLVEDDSELDPYHLQVPGNEDPPSVKKLATRLLTYKTGTLDLVPSTLDLMYIALGQSNTNSKPIEVRFQKFIAECRLHYDLVIIDCHPAGSLFTKTSLRNSDFVLILVVAQRYAVRGIGLMTTFINAKKHGAIGPLPLILFNATSRVGISIDETQIRADAKYSAFCLKSTLKKYKAFTELDGGKGYVWTNKKSYSKESWLNLYTVTKEFMQRIGMLP